MTLTRDSIDEIKNLRDKAKENLISAMRVNSQEGKDIFGAELIAYEKVLEIMGITEEIL